MLKITVPATELFDGVGNFINTKEQTLQPKMAQRMLRFRRSTLRIARAAMVIERFVMSL